MKTYRTAVSDLGIRGTGMVVRSWLPEKHSCLLLDRSRGLINGTVLQSGSGRHVQHGALISYGLAACGERFLLTDIKIGALPASWAAGDLAFIHHVLELCALFLPLHLADEDVVAHIFLLYEPLEEHRDVIWAKLVFLVRFFLLIGLYPAEDICAINRLISHVPGTMVTVGERDAMCRSLVRWLRRCIALHPLASSCKTVTFFEVVGNYET